MLCGILVNMKRKKGEIHKKGEVYHPQITVYDDYTLSPKERAVYHAILKETILNNKRCVKLSLSDLKKMTGIERTTVANQLKELEKRRRLIEVDNTQKTNKICMITTYQERFRV